MAVFGVQLEGVSELAAALVKLPVIVDAASMLAVRDAAALVERRAKEHATGRPGPRVVSGDLRRSIHTVGPYREGLGWAAQIGPSIVYGRRVELGFHGADALGRNYNQPGYPYMAPGLWAALPELAAVFQTAYRRALAL